jgi:hypothetical protein
MTKKRLKVQKNKKIPKNTELVMSVASHLDSDMDYGDSINITPLAKSLEINGKFPHPDTIRKILNEGFQLSNVLIKFKPVYKDGKLIRIEKIVPTEANNERLLSISLKTQENTENIKKDINIMKIEIDKLGVKNG